RHTLRLNRSLIIRGSSGNRPIVRLAKALRFRPLNVVGANPAQQKEFDGMIASMMVRLEGLYVTRAASFPAGEALIGRAALNRRDVSGRAPAPDGPFQLGGPRAPLLPSLDLRPGYGFTTPAEAAAFKETPQVILDSSITGPLSIDQPYSLTLNRAIVDAGKG